MTMMQKRIAGLLVALSFSGPLAAQDDAGSPARTGGKQPLTAETMWELKRLSAPAVSPDGAHTVVAVATNDLKKDQATTRLWLFDNRSGESRPLTADGINSANPVWSPDGSRILFESKRADDEVNQLYVIALAGGEAQRITTVPTGASGGKWFPDGDHVAFVGRIWTDVETWEDQGKRQKERRESKVSARVWDRAPVRYWSTFLDEREAHLYRVPVTGGEPVAITRGSGVKLLAQEGGGGAYDISPDGTEIALTVDSDTSGIKGNADVYLIAATGGEARNITAANKAGDGSPRYSPDGRWLAYSKQQVEGFYADRQRLVLRDRRSGEETLVTEGFDRSVGNPLWTDNARSVVVAVDDAGTQRLYRIDLPSGKTTAITKDTSFGSPSMSDDGRVLVALNESFVLPPTLVRIDPRSGEATQMSTFNDAALAKVDWGTYESVAYAGANGDPIQMWVNYPPGFDRTKKYPLYLLIHGGPHSAIPDGFAWRWQAQVFSGWGYVTAWHNFHGSSGFGNDFTDSINPDWATMPYEDTIKAAEWFAAQPWIDADRMAAGGGSYGGYLSTLILGREHPFKTLVAHAAVYNLYTQYASDYGGSKRRHGEFWEQPDQFRAISPHYAAANFDTPTLVIHGELDYRVPVNHGIELFNTLQNRGVRSRFVYFPDENHWVLKQNNSIRWYQEVRKWLDEFVGPDAGKAKVAAAP
jgi:dipeptidyl aminopeptidase/acylaminoacyl peptidase